jgi:periplasmic protein TonB
MKASTTRSSTPQTRAYTEGWAASILLHVFGMAGAILLATSLKLPPQPTPFTWEIAMVEPVTNQSEPQPKPEPVKQPEPTVTEPQPTVREVSKRPIEPIQKPVQPQVREVRKTVQPVTRPINQPQPTVKTTKSAQTVQTATIQPVESRAIEAQTYSVASNPTPVESQPAVTSTTPNVIEQTVAQSQAAPVETHAAPVESQTAPVTTRETIQATTEIASLTPAREQTVVEQAQIGQVEKTVTDVKPVSASSKPTVQSRTPVATEPTPKPSLREVAKATVVEEAQPSPSIPQNVVTQSVSPISKTALSHNRSIAASSQTRQSRGDYGWLAELLWHRIEQLKRYPAKARMREWEGQVILLAVISNAGEVTSIDIVKSSGYDVLDENARDVLRRASPIQLSRKFDESQVAIQIPIDYRLRP